MTRRFHLSLQRLEGRAAPGGVTESTFFAGGDAPVAGEVRRLAANAAPVISDFRASVGPNGRVTFTGTVTDDQAVAGYVVHITGNSVDVSAVVQSDGTFAVTTVVGGPADITVTAKTTDTLGATSDPVQTTFTPSN